MDSMDTLNMRLESLDKMVTEECRNILGLATQQLREEAAAQSSSTVTPVDKGTMEKDKASKVDRVAQLAKLQQAHADNESAEAWS